MFTSSPLMVNNLSWMLLGLHHQPTKTITSTISLDPDVRAVDVILL